MKQRDPETELRASWITARDSRVMYEHPELHRRGGLEPAALLGMLFYYRVPRGLS